MPARSAGSRKWWILSARSASRYFIDVWALSIYQNTILSFPRNSYFRFTKQQLSILTATFDFSNVIFDLPNNNFRFTEINFLYCDFQFTDEDTGNFRFTNVEPSIYQGATCDSPGSIKLRFTVSFRFPNSNFLIFDCNFRFTNSNFWFTNDNFRFTKGTLSIYRQQISIYRYATFDLPMGNFRSGKSKAAIGKPKVEAGKSKADVGKSKVEAGNSNTTGSKRCCRQLVTLTSIAVGI